MLDGRGRATAADRAILTIDALRTQKAIAAQIIEGEADSVLALKGSQETRHQAAIDEIDEQLEGGLGVSP